MRPRRDKAKLIVGLLSSDVQLLRTAQTVLEKKFGPCDLESPIYEFTHTDYYREEMGGGLKRKFLSFSRSIDCERAYKVKLLTGRLERRFAVGGKRRINIDPGYMTLSKLVLFSTKDYSHRIRIKDGIFAEVTLSYSNSEYRPWPWTYPDYKTKEYADLFNVIRAKFKVEGIIA